MRWDVLPAGAKVHLTMWAALHRSSEANGSEAADPGGRSDRAGVYLTNGVFLYRVVGVCAEAGGDTVELEDCYWLDVVSVPLAELNGRPLRVVVPALVEA